MIITNQIQYIKNCYADAISNNLHNFFFPLEFQYVDIQSHRSTFISHSELCRLSHRHRKNSETEFPSKWDFQCMFA